MQRARTGHVHRARRGHVQRALAGGTSTGDMQRAHTHGGVTRRGPVVGTCRGHVRRTRLEGTCRGHTQHVQRARAGSTRGARAEGTCRGHAGRIAESTKGHVQRAHRGTRRGHVQSSGTQVAFTLSLSRRAWLCLRLSSFSFSALAGSARALHQHQRRHEQARCDWTTKCRAP